MVLSRVETVRHRMEAARPAAARKALRHSSGEAAEVLKLSGSWRKSL
jgi:hypothetical protein